MCCFELVHGGWVIQGGWVTWELLRALSCSPLSAMLMLPETPLLCGAVVGFLETLKVPKDKYLLQVRSACRKARCCAPHQ